MTNKILSILIITLLAVSCTENQYSTGKEINPVVIEKSLKSAELTRIGMLVVKDQDDQEIGYFRGVQRYQMNSTNLVIKLEDQDYQAQTVYTDISGIPSKSDEMVAHENVTNQIVYYDNECNEIFERFNIEYYQLHQIGLGTLDNLHEFSLYNQLGDLIINIPDTENFEINDQGIYVESREQELRYISVNGTYQVNLTHVIKHDLAGQGIIFLDQMGMLTYVSAQGEVIFEIPGVNFFNVEEIEEENYVTYYLNGPHRKIQNKKL